MLHIAQKTEKSHKKSFAVEVFVGMMLFAIFHVSATQASDITADNVINLVNKARSNVNMAVLAKNDLLQKAAQDKVQDMIDNNYFAHVSPEGKSPWVWLEDTGYDYKYAGENLAINYTNAEDEQKAWMESPLHRKNILNPNYKEIGVAVTQGVIEGRETIIAVQMFAAQDSQAPVADTVSIEEVSKAAVAGADTTYLTEDSVGAKRSAKMDLGAIYQNNKATLSAWAVVLVIAIVIVIIDSAALIHRKHGQLLILHEARNRHT